MAQYNLSRATGRGLAANSRGNVLYLAARFDECVDMLFQICAISNCCVFLALIRHKALSRYVKRPQVYTIALPAAIERLFSGRI